MKFRERCLVLAVGVVAILMVAAGCGGGGQDALQKGGGGSSGGDIVVGSANFPEQLILGNMYADVIEDQGLKVERRLNIGTRDVLFPALKSGEITLVPEYNGALLAYLDKGADETSPEDTTKALKGALPSSLVALEASDAQDKDALVVTPETAKKYDLKNTSDLAPVADKLIVGGPPEMETRPDGLPGLKKVYGIEFEEFKPLDPGGPLTTEALANGDIDVGRFFSSQGIIDARGWVLLADDKELSPAQNIIPIIRKQDNSGKIESALNKLSATLTTEDLTKMNKKVEVDKADPAVVAKDYLKQKGLLGG